MSKKHRNTGSAFVSAQLDLSGYCKVLHARVRCWIRDKWVRTKKAILRENNGTLVHVEFRGEDGLGASRRTQFLQEAQKFISREVKSIQDSFQLDHPYAVAA